MMLKSIAYNVLMSAACVVLAMGACSCDYKVPKDPNVLVEHINAEPGLLNPILSTDAYASNVQSYIFETLLDLDNETLNFKPVLSERWEVSKDHLQYTFYLRKNVKWQDGEPFTADDVVYSYNKIQDPKVDAAIQRISFKDVEKVKALDTYTVRFTYKKPYFRALLVCGAIPIVPKHIFDDGRDFNSHPANRSPIGTGPFIFKEWKTKQKIVLEQNKSYWKEPPQLKGIVFRIIEDSTVPFQELKKGNIDLASIRAIQWERGTDSSSFKGQFNKAEYFLPGYSYIGWNMEKPFFNDKMVRRALSMMIDKEKVLRTMLFGHGVIVEGDQYYFSDAYDRSIQPYPFNKEEALKLLEASGWVDHDGDGIRDKNGVPFKFDFLYGAGSNFAAQLATMLREDLLKAGILMELRGLEFNALIRSLDSRDFDAVTLAWSGAPVMNDPYQIWHSSQISEGSNFVGFKNKEADEVIENIRSEFDDAKRNVLYKKLQKILHEEQPYTFLFTQASLVAYNKRFTNVKIYRLGVDIREWGVAKDYKSQISDFK